MSEKLEMSAQQYEQIAEELLRAAAPYKTASNHFRNKEVPRGAAHAYAGWGHIIKSPSRPSLASSHSLPRQTITSSAVLGQRSFPGVAKTITDPL